MAGTRTYWFETLGCPKNDVDSAKLEGTLLADGLVAATDPGEADVVIVNTCAFIEAARQESIDTILALDEARRPGSELIVTGCMAERYGHELADVLPEVDRVAGFGVPVTLGRKAVPSLDLLNLPRPRSPRPWAYVKIAEGCDRKCGFCAIPSFRGPQRSRSIDDILREVDELEAQEIVLVAQDLASYGKDVARLGASSVQRNDSSVQRNDSSVQRNDSAIVPLVEAVASRVPRTRLLYLYPSDLSDALIDVIGGESGVAYYDLSLQHVSRPLLRRMRRWGDGDRFLSRIQDIRARFADAAFRSNFIVGYPGETEADHDRLLRFVDAAELDWVGFFSFSREAGTYAADLDGEVPDGLVKERLAELTELQDGITSARRRALVGTRVEVLVDEPGIGRTHRETPEIDGVIEVPVDLKVGEFHKVTVHAAFGPDLEAA